MAIQNLDEWTAKIRKNELLKIIKKEFFVCINEISEKSVNSNKNKWIWFIKILLKDADSYSNDECSYNCQDYKNFY